MTMTPAPPQLGTPPPHADPEPGSAGSQRRWPKRARRAALGFVAVLVCGNLLILAASLVAKLTAPDPGAQVTDEVAGIRNFEVVDATLWRGGAPSHAEYRALAEAGVTTIVDLRAEQDLDVPDEMLADLGVTRVAIAIRDGQTPDVDQVRRFREVVDSANGIVYLHCGAGVGRTGTLAAVYLVERGGGGWDAMRANLAVGPPSLEQLAFAASLDAGERPQRPNEMLVAVSRTLDAPRRIWKSISSH